MTAIAVPATTVPTRTLLTGAVVAGPLWAVVSLTQAFTREGFDLTRHPLSALSNGSLGWVQIANFVVAGVLLIAGAAGFRRALRSRWVPRLVALAGAGMIAAGAFVMDPADGFPAGTPAGVPATLSWHSYGHMLAGTTAFVSLIAACYVLGRRFSGAASVASYAAGSALLAGDVWAMTGAAYGTVTLAAGAITALLWLAVVAARLR